jgi:ParB family transcriptional regulator, chromosome partitioning protein
MNRRKLLLANNPLLAGPSLKERSQQSPFVPYREISINLIAPDPEQPRKEFDEEKLVELATSISTYGVLNPILVAQNPEEGNYKLIAGERRYRASLMAGIDKIPAIVMPQDSSRSKEDTLAIQLVENLQREDLSSLNRAQAIAALRDTFQLSLRDIGAKIGMSKSAVQRSLELLSLPDDLLEALKQGMSESKILLLSQIEDKEIRAHYLKDLDLVSRDRLKADIGAIKQNSFTKKSGKLSVERVISTEDKQVEEDLQRALGMKVRLSRDSKTLEGGRLSIDFYTNIDLQELYKKLVGVE